MAQWHSAAARFCYLRGKDHRDFNGNRAGTRAATLTPAEERRQRHPPISHHPHVTL